MSLVTGHVAVVVVVALCATVLGMAHVTSGSDSTNVFIGCMASFAGHGVVGTLRNGKGSNG